jgi:hypothetical protein
VADVFLFLLSILQDQDFALTLAKPKV